MALHIHCSIAGQNRTNFLSSPTVWNEVHQLIIVIIRLRISLQNYASVTKKYKTPSNSVDTTLYKDISIPTQNLLPSHLKDNDICVLESLFTDTVLWRKLVGNLTVYTSNANWSTTAMWFVKWRNPNERIVICRRSNVNMFEHSRTRK